MASEVVRDGKQPITPLAGPYGHPIHPALVSLPIGAFVLSVGADIASFFVSDPGTFVTMGFWTIVVGVAGALFAGVFGLMDLAAIPRGTKAFQVGVTHLVLNVAVIALFAVNLLVRPDSGAAIAVGAGPLAISLVALALLAAAGWLGGELAYRYGVRVADESVQAEGFKGDRRQA